MNRKDFLRTTTATALGCAISGTPLNLLAASGRQRVVVLLHLKGGNDGLNTVIPFNEYDKLVNVRGNIVPPFNKLHNLTDTIGLHSSLPEIANMYNEGLINIVQEVGKDGMCIPHSTAINHWLDNDLLPQQHYKTLDNKISLSHQLAEVATHISNNSAGSVYTVTLDGFDTHTNQAETQSRLLREFSVAVNSFYKQAQQHHFDNRLIVVAFSEFGRRIKANKYGGTDHGTSGPVFVMGNDVAGGIIGGNQVLPTIPNTEDNLPVQHQLSTLQNIVFHRWLNGLPTAGSELPLFSTAQLLL